MIRQPDTLEMREYTLADQASAEERLGFLRKTYGHLLGAVLMFIALEALLLSLPFSERMVSAMLTFAGPYSWLVVLGAFMAVSYIANAWAVSTVSLATQYMGLGLFVVAEAVIMLPLLFMAVHFGGPNVIPSAAVATGVIFLGMTGVVFATRKDFSFMGPALGIAGMAALALIVCSILFGFELGVLFTVVMIAFASAFILYETSRVLHDYQIGQHVAAALALFASVALLFWYALRLFLILQRD